MDLAMKKCAGQGDGTFAIFPCKYHRLLYFGNFTVISDHLKGAHSNTRLLKKLAVTTVIAVSNYCYCILDPQKQITVTE